ncbi:MAG: rRNA maturation RNase YbeY [Oceanobacter sp.]
MSVKIIPDLDLQISESVTDSNLPSAESFLLWVATALDQRCSIESPELTIRIACPQESQELNRDYRGKDAPTNVLSFPFEAPPEVPIPLLGDLIICSEVVAREASEQSKTLESHWAHMVIHGCLHLLGYDHIKDDEAEQMESLEQQLMAQLGYPDPYQEDTQ